MARIRHGHSVALMMAGGILLLAYAFLTLSGNFYSAFDFGIFLLTGGFVLAFARTPRKQEPVNPQVSLSSINLAQTLESDI